MSTLFIKGTVMGVRKEDWLNNPEYLSSTLLMMLQNWHEEHYNSDGTYRKESPVSVKKQYGEVKQALIALENDFHNLSIVYHQMLYIKDSNI